MALKIVTEPAAGPVTSMRSWFAHLGHADSYHLWLALWHEAEIEAAKSV